VIGMFNSKDSCLTITNIAENFFEQGEEYNKVTIAFNPPANCLLVKTGYKALRSTR
jgi:hypothetical protein